MIPLSKPTKARLDALFREEDRATAAKLLIDECGDALPCTSNKTADFWDRIRFAVIKLSAGDMTKLKEQIECAKRDWRDTLVAAGFADDPQAHRSWFPTNDN